MPMSCEHLDQPLEMLSDHQKQLKPDGEMVGSIPEWNWPIRNRKARSIVAFQEISQRIASVMQRIRGDRLNTVPYNSNSGHLQFYRKNEFFGILAAADFKPPSSRTERSSGRWIPERLLRDRRATADASNTAIAEVLPYWAVSTWLFKARR